MLHISCCCPRAVRESKSSKTTCVHRVLLMSYMHESQDDVKPRSKHNTKGRRTSTRDVQLNATEFRCTRPRRASYGQFERHFDGGTRRTCPRRTGTHVRAAASLIVPAPRLPVSRLLPSTLPAPRLPVSRLLPLSLPALSLPALRLPALRLPALRLPVSRHLPLSLPALRLPALRLSALRLPALRLTVSRHLPLSLPVSPPSTPSSQPLSRTQARTTWAPH